MTISRTAAINRAADIIDSEEWIHSYEPRGLHLHSDSATNAWWLVDDDDLEELGRLLAAGNHDAYSVWCSQTLGEEIDIGRIVLDYDADPKTDLSALAAEAGAADDMTSFMVLTFLRDEVAEIIATNAEIAAEGESMFANA